MDPHIFDRVNILKAIESACLLPGGKSAVVLSNQKAGKSYLLDHIYNHCLPLDDTLFCRISLDLLKGVTENEPLTDEAFYRFFVERLADRLETWIVDRAAQEHECAQEIAEAGEVLLRLDGEDDPDSAAHRAAAKRQQQFRKQQLVELAALREMAALAKAIADKPKIKVRELVTILDRLRRTKKRVVLFIDDFQRMVLEAGFTDSLFSFLRAGNEEGSLIALATSQVHLMDSSLHADGGERPSLFNHFHTQRLEPFTDLEADSFLQWLPLEGDALSPDEIGYIRSLAGGSPFFLRAIRDQFVWHNRPAADARAVFEQGLPPAIEAGFRDIWRRCGPEQRRILRDVAANRPIATGSAEAVNLQREGYLMLNGAQARLFSALFATFVNQRGEDELERDIESSATVMYNVLPTALVFAQPTEVAPLLSFTLRNARSQKVKVRLHCDLQGLAPAVERIVTLPRSATLRHETLTVLVDKEKFRTLADPGRCQLSWGVDVLTPTGKDPQFAEVLHLKLLARDHFVFARRDPLQKVLLDYTWLIGAWVQKNEPSLIPIRKAARAAHVLSGYPAVDDPNQVRLQVEALYNAVKAHGLSYDNSMLVCHQDTNDFAQRVRIPGRVLEEGGANCLEASVLFASLLSASDLSPIILFVPGHAIVGWKTGRGPDAAVEFIETTVTDSQPFTEAARRGQEQYEKVKALYAAWQEHPPAVIADPRSFAIPVDVHQAVKARWLSPIPSDRQ